MLVGDFMIDDTNYADCLALYNFDHVDKIKGKESIVPHKCHSKLCTSCGSKEAKLRAVHIFSIALDAKHRHIVIITSNAEKERKYEILNNALSNSLSTYF